MQGSNFNNHPRWHLEQIKRKDKMWAIWCNRCDMYFRKTKSCSHGKIPEILTRKRDFLNKMMKMQREL